MDKKLRLEILEKLSSLITAGFGLVAALAWNEAIKEVIALILPQPSMVWGKVVYALIETGSPNRGVLWRSSDGGDS